MAEESENAEACKFYLNGRKAYLLYGKECNAQAIRHFERATQLDPEFARAFAWLAYCHLEDWRQKFTATPDDSYTLAVTLAQKAVTLKPNDYYTHWTLATIHMPGEGGFDSAREEFEIAFSLIDSDDPDLLAERSELISCEGNPDQAIMEMETAKSLSPKTPDCYEWLHAFAFFQKRDYASASEVLKKMSNMWNTPYILFAICEAKQSRPIPSEDILATLRVRHPGWTNANIEELAFQKEEDKDHYLAGLNLIGL